MEVEEVITVWSTPQFKIAVWPQEARAMHDISGMECHELKKGETRNVRDGISNACVKHFLLDHEGVQAAIPSSKSHRDATRRAIYTSHKIWSECGERGKVVVARSCSRSQILEPTCSCMLLTTIGIGASRQVQARTIPHVDALDRYASRRHFHVVGFAEDLVELTSDRRRI